MTTLLWIILSTFLISIFALLGIFALAINEKLLEKILLSLVGLSAGGLMGGAFLHLLPESVKNFQESNFDIFLAVLVAFIIFFLIEKLLHWRHCHKGRCEIHSFGTINLIGDAVHNFIDGLIIAASFVVDIKLGVITVIAVAMHEIPQEIGDFGVLVYAGFKKKKALILNFIVALTVVLGGIAGFFIAETAENIVPYLLPFAAGGFIYIAASDLLPEIRKETNLKKSLSSFGLFMAGILLMFLLRFLEFE